MTNPFDRTLHVGAPGRRYLPVSPHDSTDLEKIGTSLYVESGGVVQFKSVSGDDCTVTVPDHGWIFCGVTRVYATGTTASGIHAIVH
ncbi:spike base protein, RCAP_Rcc01079 family [Celeribacter baekdonensis]|uniref:spike base protein, RCAP_Rcc01079 family n=1 Tax=Pseudomonadota TaxID=1224 RepID=UPI003A90F7E6